MAFKRHFLVMIWMAFSVLSLSAKKEWNADNVPIPFLQDSTQYVSDPDGYVDRALKDSANFYLQKLKLERGVQNALFGADEWLNFRSGVKFYTVGALIPVGHGVAQFGNADGWLIAVGVALAGFAAEGFYSFW